VTTSINVPIRPGAALANPETRAFVEENIINAKFDVVTRHSWIPDRVYNKDGIVNVLANYPWREYGYKFGRWRREIFVTELPFIPWRTWQENYSFMALVDPVRGNEISEMTAISFRIEKYAGKLLFAGDPNYAGVISTAHKGKRHISIIGSLQLGGADTTISERARDLTKVMRPDYLPPVQLYTPWEEYRTHFGPWIADHPEKPGRKERF
jgi:hypothetical protein